MKYRFATKSFSTMVLIFSLALAGMAQEISTTTTSTPANPNTVVPRVVNYSGVLNDLNGKPITSVAGVTFTLYQEAEGGTPLWTEIQNVQPSKSGHYSVTLGSTTSAGLPADVFVSGEARWLGVRIEGQADQPRVLLVAVPYALKAGDAETIGGLPASAFMLANGSQTASAETKTSTASASRNTTKSAPPTNPAVTGTGTIDFIPMWDSASDIVNSVIFQKTSAIGIATTTPAATLDVNGKTDVRDTLTLFPNTTDPTVSVNGTAFKISSTGLVSFITGQTFPGAGTITGITTATGSGLSGGGTTGTLSLKVPAAGISNPMLAHSKVTLNASTGGGLTAPGAMTLGGTYAVGLQHCAADQVLESSGTAWNCATAGTGTLTGITTAAGSGLAGGGTSGTLNMSIPAAGVTNTMLQHSSITLTPGSGLTGAGTMSLGSSYNLNIDTTKIPELASANTFSTTQTFNGVPGISANSGGDGIDIYSAGIGVNANASGGYAAVAGTSASWDGGDFFSIGGGGYGVYALAYTDQNFNVGVFAGQEGGTQENVGVWGYAASGLGIGGYGEGYASSTEGTICCVAGYYSIGLWGDTSGVSTEGIGQGIGVLATVDNGYSVVGFNNAEYDSTAFFENDESSSATSVVWETNSRVYGGFCYDDVSGNLFCSGSISPVAPVSNGSKKVALNTISSPESWFEDAGSGQLSNGEAIVNIESIFGETVNTGIDYHVFLTPNGDCKGLYVAQKSATSFVVKELGGGTSSIAFDYRIMAKRMGHENERLIDVTQQTSKPGITNASGKRSVSPDTVRKAHMEKAAQMSKMSKPVTKK